MLNKGGETTLIDMKDSNNPIVSTLYDAVEENTHLQQYSFEKGFHSKKWNQAQQIWAESLPKKEKYKHTHWGRDFVIAIQQYTYEVWKGRNEILHGSTPTESKELRKEKCKLKIQELYNLPRQKLNAADKNYFKLPLQFRQRCSLSAMVQWIEIAELIHQRAMEASEKK